MPAFRFTAADLKRLAGDTVFKRGDEYARGGAVALDDVTPERIEASVTGNEIYETTLTIPAPGRVEADCTCPHAEEGNFCKHAVAAGLAALAAGISDSSASGKRESDKVVLEKHLTGMTRDALEVRLRKAMDDDRTLKRAILAEAIAARTSATDAASWRRLVEATFRATRGMDWESAGDFPGALDRLEVAMRGALSPATAPLFLDLIEDVVFRGEQATDGGQFDPEGEVIDALEKLVVLHRNVCSLSGYTSEELADRLFKLETKGGFEFVSFGPEAYAEVLGPAGLARYRERVEALFADNPPGQNEHALHRLREKLAELCADFDGRIAMLEAREGVSPAYIVKLLREAGREAEALARAERARREEKHRLPHELVDYLISSYSNSGRHPDALAVAREEFERAPSLSGYTRLLGLARAAGCEASERESALKTVSKNEGRRYGRFFSTGDPGKPDRTLRIEIALWENDLPAALDAYDSGAADRTTADRLAGALAATHPADSLRVRRREVNGLLSYTDSKNYPEVVRQLGAMLDTAGTGGLAGSVAKFIADIRMRHRAKRSLMALLDKIV